MRGILEVNEKSWAPCLLHHFWHEFLAAKARFHGHDKHQFHGIFMFNLLRMKSISIYKFLFDAGS